MGVSTGALGDIVVAMRVRLQSITDLKTLFGGTVVVGTDLHYVSAPAGTEGNYMIHRLGDVAEFEGFSMVDWILDIYSENVPTKNAKQFVLECADAIVRMPEGLRDARITTANDYAKSIRVHVESSSNQELPEADNPRFEEMAHWHIVCSLAFGSVRDIE